MAEHNRKVQFVVRRPLKLSCMCLGRPQIEVHALDQELDSRVMDDEEKMLVARIKDELDKEKAALVKSEFIGRAEIPWRLFSFEVVLRDAADEPILSIVGSRCSCQLAFCTSPCCHVGTFDIRLVDDE